MRYPRAPMRSRRECQSNFEQCGTWVRIRLISGHLDSFNNHLEHESSLRRRTAPAPEGAASGMSGVADATGWADEGDRYAALVAGEHVEWLETCENPERSAGRRDAPVHPRGEVASDRVYADPGDGGWRGGASRGARVAGLARRPRVHPARALDGRTRTDARGGARRARTRRGGGVRAGTRVRLSVPPRWTGGGAATSCACARRRARPRRRREAVARGVHAFDVRADPAFVRGPSVLGLRRASGVPAFAISCGRRSTDFERLLGRSRSPRDSRAPGDAETRVARCDWREGEPGGGWTGCRRRRGLGRRQQTRSPPAA